MVFIIPQLCFVVRMEPTKYCVNSAMRTIATVCVDTFFEKNGRNVLPIQKKVVPLHSQFGGIAYES